MAPANPAAGVSRQARGISSAARVAPCASRKARDGARRIRIRRRTGVARLPLPEKIAVRSILEKLLGASQKARGVGLKIRIRKQSGVAALPLLEKIEARGILERAIGASQKARGVIRAEKHDLKNARMLLVLALPGLRLRAVTLRRSTRSVEPRRATADLWGRAKGAHRRMTGRRPCLHPPPSKP